MAHAEAERGEGKRRRQGGRALVRVIQSQRDCEQSTGGTAQSNSGKKGCKTSSSESITISSL